MLVREAIGASVDTCSAEETVAQAAKRMTDEEHGALPVIQHGRLVGIITERDVMKAVGLGLDPEHTKVSEMMTPDPDVLEPDVRVADAADWMLAAGYRHLPVVEDDEILGILSVKDVLWALTGGADGEATRMRDGDQA